MNFAQALARIEELLKEPSITDSLEVSYLLNAHADSIAQLARVAAQMRKDIDQSDGYLGSGALMYDKLMKGES